METAWRFELGETTDGLRRHMEEGKPCPPDPVIEITGVTVTRRPPRPQGQSVSRGSSAFIRGRFRRREWRI